MSNIMKPSAPESSVPLVTDAEYVKTSSQQSRKSRRWIWTVVSLLALIAVVVLTAFGSPLWQSVGTGVLLIALTVVVLIILEALILTLVIAAITRTRTRILPLIRRTGRLFLVLVTLLVAVAGAVVGS